MTESEPPARCRAVGIEAPAKLNLFLHIVGRRADGYHLVDSLVAFADIADRICVEAGPGLSLAVDGPFAAALRGESDNLVLKAARNLADAAGVAADAAFHLDKRLPVAAGIGGGSADAAAALRALTVLWAVDLPAGRLAAMAASLGADVPVCLEGRPARVAGVGEIVAPLADPFPEMPVLLVNPGVPLPTTSVFAALGPVDARPPVSFPRVGTAEDLVAALEMTGNHLAAPALRLLPAVAEVLAALEACDGCRLARMSGSGATCFGLFSTPSAAAAARGRLAAAAPGWWVAAGHLRSAPTSPARSG